MSSVSGVAPGQKPTTLREMSSRTTAAPQNPPSTSTMRQADACARLSSVNASCTRWANSISAYWSETMARWTSSVMETKRT